MHFWKSNSPSSNRRGRRADGQPGLTFLESDRIPIHQSYWRRHRGELIVTGLAGLASLMTLMTLSWMLWANPWATGYILGPSLPLFYGVAAMIFLGSVILPIHWYRTDKRMEAILAEDDEEADEASDIKDRDPSEVVLDTGDDAEVASEHEQVVEETRRW